MSQKIVGVVWAGAIVLAAGLMSGAAAAGTFDIKDTDVDKGVTEAGVNSTFFSGYPANAERIRNSFEIGIGYGVTERWAVGVKANGDTPIGDHFSFSTVGAEQLYTLRKFDQGFGFALYGGVDVAVERDATNQVSFGPVMKFGDDKTSLTINPFFSRTFGRNATEGLDFSYGWNVKREVREGFAIGIEGYGQISNIAHAPGVDMQEHRIGPVIYFEKPLDRGGSQSGAGSMKPMKLGVKAPGDAKADAGDAPEGPKFKMEVGVLFGLTEGTQDRAFKIKGGFTF